MTDKERAEEIAAQLRYLVERAGGTPTDRRPFYSVTEALSEAYVNSCTLGRM